MENFLFQSFAISREHLYQRSKRLKKIDLTFILGHYWATRSKFKVVLKGVTIPLLFEI